MRKRHFTLAQANALLTRVRPRIQRMMQLSVHLRSSPHDDVTAAPLGTLGAPWIMEPTIAEPALSESVLTEPALGAVGESGLPIFQPDAASDASDEGRALAACLYETLSEELKGIEALGAEVKDLSIGLTVFPSFLEGQTEVLLSWTVSDAEIRSFYTPHSGYRQRKPVEGRTFTAERTPSGQLRE